MKKFLLLAASAALLGSCIKEDPCPPSPVVPDDGLIQISATFADIVPAHGASTRTSYSGSTASWVDGDALGLFCPQSTAAGVNVQYTVASTSTTPVWSTSSPIYWTDGTTAHKFLAYAPYASGNSDATAVKVPALSTQTGSINSAQDLLISSNLNSSGITRGNNVALTFTHALSLVEFKLLLGGGIATTGTTLTNFILAGASGEKLYTSDNASTINLGTGAINVSGTATNTATVTPASPPALTTTAVSYYALIVPGTYAGPTLVINFKEGGTTAFTTTSAALGTTLFEAAKKYTYTVTISRTAITITSASITDWVPGGGGSLTPGI